MRMQAAQRISTCTGFSRSLNTSPRKENQGKGLLLHQSTDPKICLTETEKKCSKPEFSCYEMTEILQTGHLFF